MMKTIDIGHQNFSLDKAIVELETGVSDAIHGGETRALKIIHGHGEGALRKEVRQWCQNQDGRFVAVIPGEEYNMFHKQSVDMRAVCGQPKDPHFGSRNRSVTYIWLW